MRIAFAKPTDERQDLRALRIGDRRVEISTCFVGGDAPFGLLPESRH